MALTYGFYNSISGDRRYNAKQMSTLFDGIIRDGVFATVGQSLMVSAGSDMTINVGTGRAWFNGTWTNNDAPLPLVVPPSETVLNRIDAVVLEVNETNEVRANSIKILKGTPATIPTNPTLTNSELVHQYPLAYIYVGANVSSIIQANITNKIGTTSTPFVTGILQTVTAEMLTAQWESEFDTWLNHIKDLFGDDPAGSLQNQVDHLGNQIDELGDQIDELGAYAIADGTNSYTATINGYTLAEGKTIRIKFTNANTGASTLNINSFGAKSILKGNGNNLSSGNIKAGQICNLVYTGSVFQLLGEGGEYGTATAPDVLQGKTIGTENGLVSGTMPNRGAVSQTITTQGGSYTIPSGYHSGSGKVTANFANLSAENVKNGVNIGGVVGTLTPMSSINGIIKSYMVSASGNISAGDFVKFIDEVISPVAILPSITHYGTIAAVALTDTKVFVAYGEGSNECLNGIVCTINGSTITTGTPVVLTTTNYTGQQISICKLSSTKVFIAHNRGNSTQSYYLNAIVCTISGTTITKGTSTQIDTNATTGTVIDVAMISESSAIIVYPTGANDYLGAVVCTVSDTTITKGTTVNLTTTADDGDTVSIVSIDTNKFLVAHKRNSSVRGVICTISGTTISKGNNYLIGECDSGFNVRSITLAKLSSSKVFVAYDGNQKTKLYGVICTISDTTITGHTPIYIYEGVNGTLYNCEALNDSEIAIIYEEDMGSDVYKVCAIKCSIVGTTIIKLYQDKILTDVDNVYRTRAYNNQGFVNLNGKLFIPVRKESNNDIYALIWNATGVSSVTSPADIICGIAETGGSPNNFINVYVPNI